MLRSLLYTHRPCRVDRHPGCANCGVVDDAQKTLDGWDGPPPYWRFNIESANSTGLRARDFWSLGNLRPRASSKSWGGGASFCPFATPPPFFTVPRPLTALHNAFFFLFFSPLLIRQNPSIPAIFYDVLQDDRVRHTHQCGRQGTREGYGNDERRPAAKRVGACRRHAVRELCRNRLGGSPSARQLAILLAGSSTRALAEALEGRRASSAPDAVRDA